MNATKARQTRVLTIEDDPAVRTSIRAFLEDHEFAVMDAADGITGLRLFEEQAPQLLLVDLRMRSPDGFEVLETVRKRRPDLPVVVLSGTGDIRDAVRALRLGAWDFVLKPVLDFDILLHSVTRALERSRMLQERQEYHTRLELDVAQRTAELELQQATIERTAAEERALGELARLSLEPWSLTAYLTGALHCLLNSTPWMGLLPKGAIFLGEETSDGHELFLNAAVNVSPPYFDGCLPTADQWPLADGLLPIPDAVHVTPEEIAASAEGPIEVSPYSLFRVPFFEGTRLLGVLVLYMPPDHVPAAHESHFLRRVGEGLSLGILRKFAEQRAEHLAFYDSLTGLPNRQLFLDRLEQAMVSAKRLGYCGAILYIDLDHFKTLNDGLGHTSGDLLLAQVAQRLQPVLRVEDTVARLGGDEFVVLLPNLQPEQQLAAPEALLVAERLRVAVAQPFNLAFQEYTVTCSIGLAMFPDSASDALELLRYADTAMYTAKREGRNQVCFFQPAMQTAVEARLNLGKELRTALENGELRVFYQPQWDVNRELLGAEALVRWQHPERGLVKPDEFVPLAEETGLILALGEWVLRESFRQLRYWSDAGYADSIGWLYINLSGQQFRQPDFVDLVRRLLDETGADPTHIGLEITESAVVDNLTDAKSKMHALKAMGLHFSVDDFGTGYSSLAYLKELPLDALKIDRSFVRDITTDANDAAIVQTIISMASNLSLAVIAEGVETQEQLDFLHNHHCYVYQGFLLSRPLPADEFIRFCRSRLLPNVKVGG